MNIDKPVILNVDDHEPSRYTRSRVLRRAGFEVHDLATGTEALSAINSLNADIVLLDVHLPDIDGLEVCRRIKQRPETAALMVLQISASATLAAHATESLNSGADCYLVEPVEPDVLVATVRALLRLRWTERELFRSNRALREANERLEGVNDALRRSNEDLEHFAHVASHDLQEPLRTIVAHSQLLVRSLGKQLETDDKESFDLIIGAAQRMRNLIDDVLTYSSVARSAPEFEPAPLNEAAAWALGNLEESIRLAGGQVTVDNLPEVWGDRTQLARMFQNLIGNALKYRSAADPCIHVGVRPPGEGAECVIYVRDNGIGIDPEYHERIFGAFKRLHGGNIPGTGVGLAVCRRIIERHGGRIWVESSPGAGATFVFTLKCSAKDETAA
jgi:signal transduction histidine kinase